MSDNRGSVSRMNFRKYVDSCQILDEFISICEVSRETTLLTSWLMNSPEVLGKSRFVSDASFAPNVLILSEHLPVLYLGATMWVDLLSESIRTGNPITSEQIDSAAARMLEMRIEGIVEIIDALSSFDDELYICIISEKGKELASLAEGIEENHWLSAFLSIKESSEQLQQQLISKAVDTEIEVIELEREIDLALSDRDEERFNMLVKKLRDITMQHND